MELISPTRPTLSPDCPSLTPLAGNEPWAVELRNKYGTGENLVHVWAPAQQRYCALNFNKAFRGDTPPETVVRVTRTFGDKIAQSLLCNQLAAAIFEANAQTATTPKDIGAVAQAICDSERLRRLTLVSVLKFFHRLRCGEYEQLMYGRDLTALKILTEMNRQFPRLMEEEKAARETAERERREADIARRGKESVSWEAYARSRGIAPEEAALGPQGYSSLQATRENERKRMVFLTISLMCCLRDLAHVLALASAMALAGEKAS